ncbi:MAG: NifB/NifX family molybdenum-iron cluster-binding protein [Campylobacterota bacterium]|nr:NifB/NifX family molybdenum-iron cluster-binding protein [Campylobacterota bacterium]
MIAIPLKLNKEDSALAPLFGKAKWFAFVEDGNISIEKNETQGGSGVVKWLLGKGVKTLIMQKMSQPPYTIIKEEGSITILYVGSDRIQLPEALNKYKADELVIVNDNNASDIIKSHDRQHQQR